MSNHTDDGSGLPDRPAVDAGYDRSEADAQRTSPRSAELGGGDGRAKNRVIELLSAGESTGRNGLERRVAASGTVAKLAHDEPASLEAFLPVLAEELRQEAEELRRETDADIADEAPENRVGARAVRANLVETVSRLLVGTSGTTAEREAFTDFVESLDTGMEDRTLRVATRALFASANERAPELASAAGLLDELLTYPDEAVLAWAAGTVGRVAATHPEAVAATAPDLRRLLTHEDSTVQHNAVEALAAFVVSHPDSVAPAADALRDLLDHEEVTIQHNAAGVLYVLAEHRPEAVMPAVEEFRHLRDHDDEAVRRIATATLARFAEDRPEAPTDSTPESS